MNCEVRVKGPFYLKKSTNNIYVNILLHCPHDHRKKHFLPRHIVVSSGLDGNEVFKYVINRMFPNKTTRRVVMLKTEFEKSQKQRKRPAIRKIITNALMKHHLSSRWEKYIQHLNNRRASPASSTSQHVNKHRHSRRSQRKRKELRLKSWKPNHKDKGAYRRRRQDGIGSRRRGVVSCSVNNSGNSTSSARLRLLRPFREDRIRRRAVESCTVNNSGNSTSSEDEQELTSARLIRLLRASATVKATDYEPAAKYQRFNPFAEREETIIHEITSPSKAAGVQVVYTRDAVEAEQWLRRHIVDCSTKAVGFDTEQRPQFVSKKDGGTENETAVLQLGVETSCLVLHIYYMSEMPESLESILRDENILKIGSGIDKDASKLTRERGLVCKGLVDTQGMATSLGLQKIGLKALAEQFLGIELDKGVALTNWENIPLHLRQIEYAALDAWVGLKVYQEMKRQKKSPMDIKTSPRINYQNPLARFFMMKLRRKRK